MLTEKFTCMIRLLHTSDFIDFQFHLRYPVKKNSGKYHATYLYDHLRHTKNSPAADAGVFDW